jgi:hypothetical protein
LEAGKGGGDRGKTGHNSHEAKQSAGDKTQKTQQIRLWGQAGGGGHAHLISSNTLLIGPTSWKGGVERLRRIVGGGRV